MGLFYYLHSPAFLEELPVEFKEGDSIESFNKKVDDAYTQVALNVWIAAALYVVVLAISVHQFRANIRK